MHDLGGKVEAGEHATAEFGRAYVTPTQGQSAILKGWFEDGSGREQVWMSHGDHVSEIAPKFEVLGTSPGAPFAITADLERNFYAVQFHPEVHHTPNGKTLYENFVKLAGFSGDWTMDAYRDQAIAAIREQVGDAKVICGLSGGVDSSVAAALIHEAIGDQLTCVFVDNGLLRLNEGDEVMKTFSQNLGVKVIRADAQEYFYDRLSDESDPELKRKIIGRAFIETFNQESQKLKDIKFLAQGTIYPDVIESAGAASGKAKVIKSHHNVGGLPDDMHFELVEPLKELFKDEVREIGVRLGLAKKMLYRHPFPGPGLGVRILGHVKKEYADILRQADYIFMEELNNHDLYDKVDQAFAAFLPVKSVGVTGDERRYDYVIALRAVETIDFMTARWARLPYDFLDHVSNRIMNEIARVSRVVYDISGKPPATIEWE